MTIVSPRKYSRTQRSSKLCFPVDSEGMVNLVNRFRYMYIYIYIYVCISIHYKSILYNMYNVCAILDIRHPKRQL